MAEITKVKASIGRDRYQTVIQTDKHELIGDEPIENNGTDLGPDPYEFILAGLATCTAATLRMYADRKGWDLEQLEIELSLQVERVGVSQSTNILRELHFVGNLDDEQKAMLLNIAEKCPVHKLLTNQVIITTKQI
ncbi:osmotically inducible protein C [Emticicia aquatilis]|uniref:Osmotically inducible protein C n=1 Tax=Emticicia aquatilis TaxID=1537369 RepID=A0A916Z838_9BACT|nr:OsmC family protein [Emticicia aquatilis]GGD79741.1 osmotically inducible protein C [Emticicia aquatilis]